MGSRLRLGVSLPLNRSCRLRRSGHVALRRLALVNDPREEAIGDCVTSNHRATARLVGCDKLAGRGDPEVKKRRALTVAALPPTLRVSSVGDVRRRRGGSGRGLVGGKGIATFGGQLAREPRSDVARAWQGRGLAVRRSLNLLLTVGGQPVCARSRSRSPSPELPAMAVATALRLWGHNPTMAAAAAAAVATAAASTSDSPAHVPARATAEGENTGGEKPWSSTRNGPNSVRPPQVPILFYPAATNDGPSFLFPLDRATSAESDHLRDGDLSKSVGPGSSRNSPWNSQVSSFPPSSDKHHVSLRTFASSSPSFSSSSSPSSSRSSSSSSPPYFVFSSSSSSQHSPASSHPHLSAQSINGNGKLFELSQSKNNGDGFELQQLRSNLPSFSSAASSSSSSPSFPSSSPSAQSSSSSSSFLARPSSGDPLWPAMKLPPSTSSSSHVAWIQGSSSLSPMNIPAKNIFSPAAVFIPVSSVHSPQGSFPSFSQAIAESQLRAVFSPALFSSSSSFLASGAGGGILAGGVPTAGVRWARRCLDEVAPVSGQTSTSTAVWPRALHTWHVPKPGSGRSEGGGGPGDGPGEVGGKKQAVTVVLLGWLGCQQKHLRRYAEWYTSQGMNAVTFVVPMSSVLSLGPDGKAEKHVQSLVEQLERWIVTEREGGVAAQAAPRGEAGERSLVFHTFSNTGWLTYGAVLEALKKRVPDAFQNIRGCIVDSAPVVDPDPQVWASGFSAAILKKRSASTLSEQNTPAKIKVDLGDGLQAEIDRSELPGGQQSPTEAALKKVLEKFFSVFLEVPIIRRRLMEVTSILQKEQPKCPQLYIYSTSDAVIPHTRVEAFMEMQKQNGVRVMGRRLEGSPHVDHFRTAPHIYTSQLQKFLQCCFGPVKEGEKQSEELATAGHPC
ncbi:hypothetical protein CBR_g28544 [Chara braunii]|uniref:Transmembrane protein 53 n=1 Tax=Chara braunii TaxID=69332 RepID=A0A388JWB8_CHABU|nr:hypothetical protein CBR_g28544 [Chara braunii]|eukprot:GBG62067.1 hypothetical protein CBR_g28544 [Chara braunii]